MATVGAIIPNVIPTGFFLPGDGYHCHWPGIGARKPRDNTIDVHPKLILLQETTDTTMLKMNDPVIKIKGARQHNLKNLDLDIPLHKFTVVTGVSGSGKSSLALDTLYAEGQRRDVETLSP